MGRAPYSAAKWGVEGFSEVLAKDVRPLAQPGDPVKAAAVIMHIATLDEPPLRLLLGSDAIRLAEQNDFARMDADKKWRELSVSTDYVA